MPLLRFILFTALLFATKAKGQQPFNFGRLAGKTFVSTTLDYLKILSNTKLYSSINSYTDTANYYLQNDTVFIKQKYLQTDQTGTKWMNRVYAYKISTFSDDTIELIHKDPFVLPPREERTFLFINIEKLKESVKEFKFLNLNSSRKKITIDSLGNVTFYEDRKIYNYDTVINIPPLLIKGRLTQNAFVSFKNLLSKSLPSKLPSKRPCGIDSRFIDFEILIGNRNIKSVGCELSWTHDALANYLYNIDKNKYLIRRR